MDSGCRTGSKGEREGEKSGIELSVIVVRERELSVSVCESVCVRACVGCSAAECCVNNRPSWVTTLLHNSPSFPFLVKCKNYFYFFSKNAKKKKKQSKLGTRNFFNECIGVGSYQNGYTNSH